MAYPEIMPLDASRKSEITRERWRVKWTEILPKPHVRLRHFSGVTFAYAIFLGWTRQNMSVASPKSSLLDGAEILEKVLAPQDFHFQFHGEGFWPSFRAG
jgi:hypothetical protein